MARHGGQPTKLIPSRNAETSGKWQSPHSSLRFSVGVIRCLQSADDVILYSAIRGRSEGTLSG